MSLEERMSQQQSQNANRPQNWEPNAAAHAAMEQFYALRQPEYE